jgi:ABC-2 type transport system permease protein
MTSRSSQHLRAILAIAGKDMAYAIQNKVTLGIMIGVLLLILPTQMLRLIIKNESPLAVIYAPKAYQLAERLTEETDVRAFAVRSQEDLQNEILAGRTDVIGLVFPNDFSLDDGSGESWTIQAYFPHWTSDQEIANLINLFTEKIQVLTSDPIRIEFDKTIYPNGSTGGSLTMFILQMVNAILTITLVLVPQLIMSERETHTIEALLVSPVRPIDIVAGKGLVGVAYGFLAAFLVAIFNAAFISQWGLLLLSVLSGICLAVLIGLLIGLLFENFQQASMALFVVLFLAIGPAFINLLVTAKLPEFVAFILKWLPSGQLAALLQMSLMEMIDWPAVLSGLGIIWLSNLILMGLILLRLRREMD